MNTTTQTTNTTTQTTNTTTQTTTPRPHAVVERTWGSPASFTVWAHWPGVDRPRTYGISVGPDIRTAQRLATLMVAGLVFPDAHPETDCNGHTYMAGRSEVMGRTLMADIERLEGTR